jgi:LacI family transcriptional regulator
VGSVSVFVSIGVLARCSRSSSDAPSAGNSTTTPASRLCSVDRPPGGIDADFVTSDHAGGAREATAHLLAAGHRRTSTWATGATSRALVPAGVAYDPALVRMEVEHSAMARRATEELFSEENPPTAVFAAQNRITIGAVEALRAMGRRHDVALVVFDDLVLADALDPALTVVAQDAVGIGRAAAELLFARPDGDDGPARTIVRPTTLIARGSGEIRRGGTA